MSIASDTCKSENVLTRKFFVVFSTQMAAEETFKCDRCGQDIPLRECFEHSDYHAALDLHREENGQQQHQQSGNHARGSGAASSGAKVASGGKRASPAKGKTKSGSAGKKRAASGHKKGDTGPPKAKVATLNDFWKRKSG